MSADPSAAGREQELRHLASPAEGQVLIDWLAGLPGATVRPASRHVTIYFDTPALDLHHEYLRSGGSHARRVRLRRYGVPQPPNRGAAPAGHWFLELKVCGDGSRRKTRIALRGSLVAHVLAQPAGADVPPELLEVLASGVVPWLATTFLRTEITLPGQARVTVDGHVAAWVVHNLGDDGGVEYGPCFWTCPDTIVEIKEGEKIQAVLRGVALRPAGGFSKAAAAFARLPATARPGLLAGRGM